MREIGCQIEYEELKDGDKVKIFGLTGKGRNDMAVFLGMTLTVEELDSENGMKEFKLSADWAMGEVVEYCISFEGNICLTDKHLKLVLVEEAKEEVKEMGGPLFKMGDRVLAFGVPGKIIAIIQRQTGWFYEIHNKDMNPEIFTASEQDVSPYKELVLTTRLIARGGEIYIGDKVSHGANIEITFDETRDNILKVRAI